MLPQLHAPSLKKPSRSALSANVIVFRCGKVDASEYVDRCLRTSETPTEKALWGFPIFRGS